METIKNLTKYVICGTLCGVSFINAYCMFVFGVNTINEYAKWKTVKK